MFLPSKKKLLVFFENFLYLKFQLKKSFLLFCFLIDEKLKQKNQ